MMMMMMMMMMMLISTILMSTATATAVDCRRNRKHGANGADKGLTLQGRTLRCVRPLGPMRAHTHMRAGPRATLVTAPLPVAACHASAQFACGFDVSRCVTANVY